MLTDKLKQLGSDIAQYLQKDRLKSSLKRGTAEFSERAVKKNVRIAVTGLSGAGKSAFIASLVNQLTMASSENALPLWNLQQQGKFLGAKLIAYDELHIPAFKYQQALDSICGEPSRWPESTKEISQARVCVRYKISNSLVRKVQAHSHINIDIIDYPGEWLMDLPMLTMNFKQWSLSIAQWMEQSPQKEFAEEFRDETLSIELQKGKCNEQIKHCSDLYKSFLLECKSSNQGLVNLQPGRFILPGSLAGAPVLEFFPIVNKELLAQDWINCEDNSLIRYLENCYNYYREQIVKPFYKEYFSKVDRQILLVDAQSVLNQGYNSYLEQRTTLSNIVNHYNYGQVNWFKRLFKPSVDKLVIAASKVDHVPAEQHQAMQEFVERMLVSSKSHAGYEGVEVKTMTLSSIAVTEQVRVNHNGEELHCVKGFSESSSDGKKVVNFPGKVPVRKLTKQEWEKLEFNFEHFSIPRLEQDEPFPHIRMDKAIEHLIGDLFI